MAKKRPYEFPPKDGPAGDWNKPEFDGAAFSAAVTRLRASIEALPPQTLLRGAVFFQRVEQRVKALESEVTTAGIGAGVEQVLTRLQESVDKWRR